MICGNDANILYLNHAILHGPPWQRGILSGPCDHMATTWTSFTWIVVQGGNETNSVVLCSYLTQPLLTYKLIDRIIINFLPYPTAKLLKWSNYSNSEWGVLALTSNEWMGEKLCVWQISFDAQLQLQSVMWRFWKQKWMSIDICIFFPKMSP